MPRKHDGKGQIDSRYTTISLPSDLVKHIDKFIEMPFIHGYKNRTDFCTEAVRLRIQELTRLYKESFD